MSEVYLTGRTKDNVLEAAAEIDGTKLRTVVPAVSDFEAELQAAYKVIVKAAEKKEDIHLHTDFKSPVGYINGTFKGMAETTRAFKRNITKLKKTYGIEITGDDQIDKAKADMLYEAAFANKDKPAPVEKPLNKPKREVGTMRGWINRTTSVDRKPMPKWSVKVIQDDKCIIDISNLDFSGFNDEQVRKDAAYLADWWEQVEKATVVRSNIPAHQHDFSKYKGTNLTAVDVEKGQMTVWKDGAIEYQGKVLHSYKEKYAKEHPDSEWAKELKEESEREAAVEAAKEEEQEEIPEYEQLGFEF